MSLLFNFIRWIVMLMWNEFISNQINNNKKTKLILFALLVWNLEIHPSNRWFSLVSHFDCLLCCFVGTFFGYHHYDCDAFLHNNPIYISTIFPQIIQQWMPLFRKIESFLSQNDESLQIANKTKQYFYFNSKKKKNWKNMKKFIQNYKFIDKTTQTITISK